MKASPLPLQKSVDLLLAFGLEQRAGAIEQPAAGREQRPERIEQARLGGGERRRCRSPGAASGRRDGGGRCPSAARRVEQDRVERPAVPPGARARRRRRAGRGPQAEAGERLVDPRQPCRRRGRSQRSRSASSSRCAVLPPGAAQASRTRAPAGSGAARSSGAARWALPSCTETSPSAKPGRLATGTGRPARRRRRRAASPRCRARPGSRRYSAAVARRALTRNIIGAWTLSASATPASDRARRAQPLEPPARMVEARERIGERGRDEASRSRTKRRRTALTKAALRANRCDAAVTAWSTSVCSA